MMKLLTSANEWIKPPTPVNRSADLWSPPSPSPALKMLKQLHKGKPQQHTEKGKEKRQIHASAQGKRTKLKTPFPVPSRIFTMNRNRSVKQEGNRLLPGFPEASATPSQDFVAVFMREEAEKWEPTGQDPDKWRMMECEQGKHQERSR